MFENQFDTPEIKNEELFKTDTTVRNRPLQQCPLYLISLSFEEKIVQVSVGLN